MKGNIMIRYFKKNYIQFKIECPKKKKTQKNKKTTTTKQNKKQTNKNAFHVKSNRCSPAVFARNVFEPLASRASRFTKFTSPAQNLLAQIKF
jgi:hypothetical protein